MPLVLLYLLPFFLSLLISLSVGLYCWKRGSQTGAMMYALVAFSQASWTFGYIFELISPTLKGKIFWDNFQFIGGNGWLIAFVAFVLAYTGWHFTRPWLTYILIALPCLSITLLAYTDPLHGLIRPNTMLLSDEPFGVLLYDLTTPFWLWGIYGYILFLACLGLLFIKYIQSHPLYRTQVLLILIGNLMPLIGTILTLTGVVQGPYRDMSPFTFAIGNLFVVWGLFRYQLFDIVPLAWDKVIENISDAVIVLDAQDRVINLNAIARRMTGLKDERLIGQSAAYVFAVWPELIAQYQKIRDTHTEIEINTAIGRRHIELRIQPFYDQRQNFKGRVVIARDITAQKLTEEELRQHRDHLEDLVKERTAELLATNQQLQQQISQRENLEKQLRQAQKLEAIGRLAGGIAHDFNNLLVPIMGYVGLSLMNLKPATKLYDDLTQVRKAAEQASRLTRQILAFSRQQLLELNVLNLNEVVTDFKKMLQRVIGEDIELKTVLTDQLYRIKADKGQIEQVLMNLVINARDAMPDGGKIIIETSNVSLDKLYMEKYAANLSPGDYIMLSISDTGHGIDAETQSRIFDPFFTTKGSDKGTGLGLATVFGIITQHQGHIWVYSEVGQGTTFKIYLPRAAEETTEIHPAVKKHTSLYGTETVLVVEDEDMVRKLVCETLEAYGYDVIEAANPTACLELASDKTAIHLLLTDVIMPEMNGKELYQKFVTIHPHSKLLYMSGYTNDVISHHGILDKGVNFLQKPFTIHSLARKVRETLDLETKPSVF